MMDNGTNETIDFAGGDSRPVPAGAPAQPTQNQAMTAGVAPVDAAAGDGAVAEAASVEPIGPASAAAIDAAQIADAPAHHRHASESTAKKLASQWNNPANIVTLTRIALVVVFIALLAYAGVDGQRNLTMRWVAFALFIIAASTDKLDGYLARSRNEVTDLGKLLDPIADKLLICSTLVVMSIFGELWWWVTALFLIREIGITVLRFLVIDKKHIVIAANSAGKLKTVFESVSLAFLLAPMWQFNFSVNPWVLYYYYVTYALIGAALGLCLYSGLIYVIEMRRQLRAGKAIEADSRDDGEAE